MSTLQMIRLTNETLQEKLREARRLDDGTPDASRQIRQIQDALACKMPEDQFPAGFPSFLRGAALRAKEQGLTLVQFNSGSRFNSSNGIRVFGNPGYDYFEGSHMAHLRTVDEVDTFLEGFMVGLRSSKPWLRGAVHSPVT